ncbi:MAG: exodeoxyribonuclease VII large subunit [Bilophila sp.]
MTAPRGAAVRDFLRLSAERGTGCEIHIIPVPVQGDDAPPRIAAALDPPKTAGAGPRCSCSSGAADCSRPLGLQ